MAAILSVFFYYFDSNSTFNDGAVLFPLSTRGRHSPPQTDKIIGKKNNTWAKPDGEMCFLM